MGDYETFSKRMKRLEKQGQADAYQYDELSNAFRVQVVHIWADAIGHTQYPDDFPNKAWSHVARTMAREKGVFSLGKAQ